VDRSAKVISFARKKPRTVSMIHFGDEVEAVLKTLPLADPFLPRLRKLNSAYRATEFTRVWLYPSSPGLSTRIASCLAVAGGFRHNIAPWPVSLSHVGVPTTTKRKETTMFVLRTLRSVIGDCVRVINFGAKIQEPARAQLVQSLKEICGRCDDTYSKLLEHLSPIKAGLHRPAKLAVALRLEEAHGDARKELAVYLRNIIKDFEAELKATVSEVRKAKDRIVR
jgi:hypothetical protein